MRIAILAIPFSEELHQSGKGHMLDSEVPQDHFVRVSELSSCKAKLSCSIRVLFCTSLIA